VEWTDGRVSEQIASLVVNYQRGYHGFDALVVNNQRGFAGSGVVGTNLSNAL